MAGIIGDHLLGPIYLPNRLNGVSYLDFLTNELPNHFEDIPIVDRRNQWFMHDGAPAHFSRAVREFLDETYGDKWIGRGGPLPWPARSPDFNPIDFCLWGWVKCIVYQTEVESENDLRTRIDNAFVRIKNVPQVFENIRNSYNKRLNQCIAMNGGHFEHLL